MTDSDSSTPPENARYRIGAVCRLTGISQHVLRVWEKRYNVVEPERSETGRRLYSESDVTRLSLLKTLVDRGQAIGTIAQLDNSELERRSQQSAGSLQVSASAEKPTLALFGHSLATTMEDCASSAIFSLKGLYNETSDFISQDPTKRLDIAVIEWPSLQADSAIDITRHASRLNARHIVVVYDYAPRSLLQRLASNRITALRSPLDIAALEAVVAWRFGLSAQQPASPDLATGVVSSREFNDRELAYLAAQSSAIACECPMHLAQLITRLVNFETYSAECESRNSEDAAVHHYLYNTTSRARSLMEKALSRVVELENLTLPTDN